MSKILADVYSVSRYQNGALTEEEEVKGHLISSHEDGQWILELKVEGHPEFADQWKFAASRPIGEKTDPDFGRNLEMYLCRDHSDKEQLCVKGILRKKN